MTAISEEVRARFWAKVLKTDSCWIWTACKDKHGYGRFRFNGETVSAPRVAYILTHGEIPTGMGALHDCPNGGDNPSCVNPAHLWLGTHLDNLADMDRKGRRVPPNGAAHSIVMSRVAARGDKHGTKTHPEAFPRGTNVPVAKLTDEQVRKIRSSTTLSQRKLAAQFKVSHTTIGEVLRNKRWKHVA